VVIGVLATAVQTPPFVPGRSPRLERSSAKITWSPWLGLAAPRSRSATWICMASSSTTSGPANDARASVPPSKVTANTTIATELGAHDAPSYGTVAAGAGTT
jgi:hypothetical protein